MALDRFGAETFLTLKQRGAPLERVLTFGRQHLAVSKHQLKDVPGLREALGEIDLSAEQGDIFADPFFRGLGVETLESLDASEYESCSFVHDLNEPIPADWHSRYDAVFDGGTLEHVYHFPNAIENAMNLVKPGGILITQSPSNNLNGHGFYQFSPELFFRVFDRSNGFRILCMAFVETEGKGRKYQVIDPEKLGKRVTYGGHGPLQLIMVAKREEAETISLKASPYQSDYSATWQNQENQTNDSNQTSPETSAIKRFKNLVRQSLPADWLRAYDQNQVAKARKRSATAGIIPAGTLAECFIRDESPRK